MVLLKWYKAVSKILKNVDFSKNMEYKSTLAAIHRNYPRGTAKLELFQAYGLILNNCDKHLDELIGLVTKYFTKTVDKDSNDLCPWSNHGSR